MSGMDRIIGEKYRLQRTIGVGGMGTVYEAVHLVTQRRVALKVMHAHVLRSAPNVTKRFLKEARAAAAISHPGIVDVLDAGQEPDGSLYLVLELLDGLDLEKAVKRRIVGPLEAVRICRDVCAPLAAAHRRGLIHRDIKPANIFLAEGKSGRSIKLLDFGIVKERDDQITARGSLVGTIEYMSPEQAVGTPVDPRSDIFSLGATMFFAVAGRPPFRAEQQFDLLQLIATTDAPPLRELAPSAPADLCAVIDRCLAKNKEDRWQSVAELESALSRCAGESQRVRTRSLRAAPPILALMVLGIAGAIALLREPNQPAPSPPPASPAATRTILVHEVTVEPPPPVPVEPPAPAPRARKSQLPRSAASRERRGPYDPMRAYR